ncbi:MAG: hypothetical protein HQL84_03250 [Magnetococcales bacterium]|nr:hypothetical protein [Magnetococcales bacterium]MBF0149043.1 hypothetical protein [Magnetococcales bacterium]MBF0172092.1 hypothetical protein [Magnetococcales bacterium]MBF0346204.1 hypothetical protein [Magnetococcales bacterium]MBF0632626.1 hypothetical protein [Magnetococcales bacterium]
MMDQSMMEGSRVMGSIRVACATHDAVMLDGHFGSCPRFMIYDVSATTVVAQAGRACDGIGTAGRVAMIQDCQVVCLQSIGGPAAGRVSQSGVLPLKFTRSLPIEDVLELIRARMADHPPPWMVKAAGVRNAAV